MAQIEIRIQDHGVLDALNRLLAAGTDFSPLMRQIGEQLLESTEQRFSASATPAGKPWPSNAQSTILALLSSFNEAEAHVPRKTPRCRR